MFKWLNKQGVESQNGFIVQVVSRFVIEYSEGSKKISIPIEVDTATTNKVAIIIHKISFSRWNDGANISVKEQLQIINNFVQAMNFQKVGVIVEEE